MKKYRINESSKEMDKILCVFLSLFVSSLFPFRIVEFYFQEYFTVDLIGVIASVILTLYISIKHLKEKFM